MEVGDGEMKYLFELAAVVVVEVLLVGCGQNDAPSITRGSITIECDESVLPVMQMEAEDFHFTYPEATVTLRSVEAREAVADFVNDSVQVIVCGRAFNKEEREAIAATTKIELHEYKVALDAVAVIGHKDNPQKHLRISELDSIFSGSLARWEGKPRNNFIDVAIGGINSSTNEIFRTAIFKNSPATLTGTRYASSKDLLEFVRTRKNAIGIVGLNWLKGIEQDLTVFALGDPAGRADSTEPMGKYYSPAQAYVYKNYYPLVCPIYIYSRDVNRNVGVGFISYVGSALGQKIFLNNGLVPTTMPVHIVELTSKKVH
jgi:phosphate transport system substrate-binding protein